MFAVAQANDGVQRVSELQKEVAHLKQQLHKGQLAAAQAAQDTSTLQVGCTHTSTTQSWTHHAAFVPKGGCLVPHVG